MLTRQDAAAELGVSSTTFDKVVECGLVSKIQISRGVALYPELSEGSQRGIDKLRDAPSVRDLHDAVVVRMGRPSALDQERVTGWHVNWTEAQKNEAASRYWSIAFEEGVKPLVLVAVVANWIVGAWSIEAMNYDELHSGWIFDIEENLDLARSLNLKRLELGKGRNALYLA